MKAREIERLAIRLAPLVAAELDRLRRAGATVAAADGPCEGPWRSEMTGDTPVFDLEVNTRLKRAMIRGGEKKDGVAR